MVSGGPAHGFCHMLILRETRVIAAGGQAFMSMAGRTNNLPLNFQSKDLIYSLQLVNNWTGVRQRGKEIELFVNRS